MASHVDEKIAKITLDNKAFNQNAKQTLSVLDKLKNAFKNLSSKSNTKGMSKSFDDMTNGMEKSVNKTTGLLGKLKSIFKKANTDIDMSGAAKSVDKMNTDIANKTARTSDILSRLKNIFKKADSGIDFRETTASIDKLSNKTNSFDASGLSAAFEKALGSVNNSISAMDIAVGNLMATGIQKAMGFAGNFTRGWRDGLHEYNTELNSVQTIKSNTEKFYNGDTKRQMLDINRTLEDLNEYADLTIYSFEDMTRNIGTFTAAGVGLEDSATAIKGIANLAAASGSNAHQAGHAMYQLSQALASGKVNLMDWNSVVNAGMGGTLFQDALKDTAKEMGKTIDETKMFRDTLQDGWLTAEVLIATLKKFSVNESMLDAATKVKSLAQLIDTTQEAIGSGWATSWKLMLGDLEQAKELWSGIAAIVGEFVDDNQGKYFDEVLQMERNLGNFRNAVLRTWADMGGRQDLFDGITNSVKFLINSLTSWRMGVREVIGSYEDVAKSLHKVTQGFSKWTQSLANNNYIQRGIQAAGAATATAFLTLGKIIGNVFSGFAKTATDLNMVWRYFEYAARGAQKFFESIRSNTNIMSGFNNIGQIMGNIFTAVVNVFLTAASAVKQLLSAFNINISGAGFKSFTEFLLRGSEALVDYTSKLRRWVNSSKEVKSVGSVLAKTFEIIGTAIGGLVSLLFGSTSGMKSVFSMIGDVIGGLASNIGSKLADFANAVKSSMPAIQTWLGDRFKDAVNVFKKTYDVLKQAFQDFKIADVVTAIGTLMAALTLKKIKGGKDGFMEFIGKFFKKNVLDEFYKSLTNITDNIGDTLESFGNSVNAFSGMVNATKLLLIATAIGVLTMSISKLAKMEMRDMSKGLIGIGTAVFTLVKAMSALSKVYIFDTGMAKNLIALAIAIRIMASAMKAMSGIDSENLPAVMVGLVGAVTSLAGGLALLERIDGGGNVGIMKMLGMAISVRILASALNALRGFDGDSMGIALVGLVGAIVSFASGLMLLDNITIKIRTILSLIPMAAAVFTLCLSLKQIAKLKPDAMIGSVIGLSGLMMALATSVRIMNDVKVSLSGLIGLTAFVTSAYFLTQSLVKLSKLPVEKLIVSATLMGTLLLVLARSAKSLNNVEINLSSIGLIIAFAGSVYLIAEAMKKIAKMDLEGLIQAGITVGILIGTLVGASHLMKNAKISTGSALGILTFGVSIYAMVKAMEPLATMPIKQLVQAMISVEILLGSIVVASKLLSKIDLSVQDLTGLVVMMGSLYLMAKIVKDISKLKPENSLASAAALSGMLVAIAGSIRLMGEMSGGLKKAITTAIILESYARLLKNVGKVLQDLSDISWENMINSLVAIGTVVGILSVLVNKLNHAKGSDLAKIGTLLSMSQVLNVVGKSLSALAKHSWQEMLVAVGAMASTIGILIMSMKLIGQAGVGDATSLLILAVSLNAIAIPIKMLSTIGWAGVAVGMAALAGSLALLIGAGMLAKVVAPGLMVLSKAMMAFGLANLFAAAGFALTAAGFTAITLAITNLAKIAPGALKGVVEAFVVLIQAIEQNAGMIVKTLVNIVLAGLEGLAVVIPKAVETGMKILIELGKGLKQSLPELIKIGTELLIEFMKSLAENASIMVQTGVELATTLVEELAKALMQVKDRLIPALKDLFSIITEVLLEVLGELVEPVMNKLGEILEPVIEYLVGVFERLAVALEPVLIPIAEVLISFFENAKTIISDVCNTIIEIVHGIETVVTVFGDVVRVVGETIQAVFQSVENIVVAVCQTIQAVVQGVADIIRSVGESIKSVLEGVGSVFESVGQAIQSVLEGLGSVFESVGEAIKSVLEGIGQVFESWGQSIKTVLEGVGEVFESVGESIATVFDSIGGVIESFGTAVTSVLEAVAKIFESMGEAALNAGKGMDKIADAVAKLVGLNLADMAATLTVLSGAIKDIAKNGEDLNTAGDAMSALGTGLSAIAQAGMVASTVLTTLASTLPTISTAMQQLPDPTMQVATGMQQLGTAIIMAGAPMMTFAQAVTTTGSAVNQLGSQLGMTIPTIEALKMSMMSVPEALNAIGTAAGVALQGINALSSGAVSSLTGIGSAAIALGVSFATMGTQAVAGATAVISAFTMMNAAVRSQFTAMQQAVTQSFNQIRTAIQTATSQMRTTIQSATQSMRTSIQTAMNQMQTSVRTSFQQIVNAVRSGGQQMTNLARTIGQQTGQNITNGIRNAVGGVTGAMQSLIAAVRGQAGAAQQGGFYVGSMISQGVANGMRSAVGAIAAAANEIISHANRAAQAKAQIKSPSRLFARTVGRFIPEGVAMGIRKFGYTAVNAIVGVVDDMNYDAINAMESMNNDLADVARDAMNVVADVIDHALQSDLDFSPTVTPVIDLDNIREAELLTSSINKRIKMGTKASIELPSTDRYQRYGGSTGDTITNNDSTTNISVNVNMDSVPDPKAFAQKVSREIKRELDTTRMSKGEYTYG